MFNFVQAQLLIVSPIPQSGACFVFAKKCIITSDEIARYLNEICFQVKAASPRAKIVKASWIEASHRARVRYPWRRHCLDPAHSSQPESEDEVWDEQLCQQQEA